MFNSLNIKSPTVIRVIQTLSPSNVHLRLIPVLFNTEPQSFAPLPVIVQSHTP